MTWFTRNVLAPALAGLALVFISPHARGAETTSAGTKLPEDAAAAWTVVQTTEAALQPPPEWRSNPPNSEQSRRFRERVKSASFALAAEAREFLQKFPANTNAPEARKIVIRALSTVAAGNPIREEELTHFIESIAADPSVPEDERVDMRLMLIRAKALRLVPAKGRPAADLEFALGFQQLIREFHRSERAFRTALGFARSRVGQDATNLARAITISEAAPAEIRRYARDYLDGKRPFQLGQPLDIKFTAVDGRQVDLSALKGKVVLIDFWATWCLPCLEALPAVKDAYARLHDRGFEIIGLSFDSNNEALTRFLKQKAIPWPQYFDGKGWENAFGTRFDINDLPTQWLVDKQGILRETAAIKDLPGQVEKLLAE